MSWAQIVFNSTFGQSAHVHLDLINECNLMKGKTAKCMNVCINMLKNQSCQTDVISDSFHIHQRSLGCSAETSCVAKLEGHLNAQVRIRAAGRFKLRWIKSTDLRV